MRERERSETYRDREKRETKATVRERNRKTGKQRQIERREEKGGQRGRGREGVGRGVLSQSLPLNTEIA